MASSINRAPLLKKQCHGTSTEIVNRDSKSEQTIGPLREKAHCFLTFRGLPPQALAR